MEEASRSEQDGTYPLGPEEETDPPKLGTKTLSGV